MDSISNLPLSLMYKWYTVSEPLVHLQGRFWKPGLFSSLSLIAVARWMQRRQEEWTAAISTRALKESDGPSYFHLTNEHPIVTQNTHWEDQIRKQRELHKMYPTKKLNNYKGSFLVKKFYNQNWIENFQMVIFTKMRLNFTLMIGCMPQGVLQDISWSLQPVQHLLAP